MPAIKPDSRFVVVVDEQDNVLGKYESKRDRLDVVEHESAIYVETRDKFNEFDDPPATFPP